MTDSVHKPPPAKKKRLPFWMWAIVWTVVMLLAAVFAIPFYGHPAERDPKLVNLVKAKGIFPAIQTYAGDHDGAYPLALAELDPDYILNLKQIGFQDRDSGRRYDWLYVQGLNEASPSTWIVLASPTDQLSATPTSQRRQRIVVYNDGSAAVLSGEKFDAALDEQLKAMAARASEKP